MSNEKKKHGGRRDNQTGRPRIPLDQKKITISLYIPAGIVDAVGGKAEAKRIAAEAIYEQSKNIQPMTTKLTVPKTKMSAEEKIFAVIDEMAGGSDILDGDLHIIDMTDEYPQYDGEVEYRVYHKKGYCATVAKRANVVDHETDKVKTWRYIFNAEWPEFDGITPEDFLKLISK